MLLLIETCFFVKCDDVCHQQDAAEILPNILFLKDFFHVTGWSLLIEEQGARYFDPSTR